MPTWLGGSRFAYLDDRSGVPHLFVADIDSGYRTQLTAGDERIQSLIGAGDTRLIVGTDAGGNERQQLRLVDVVGERVTDLTSSPDRIFESYVVSRDGGTLIYRTNDGKSGEFSLWRMDTEDGTTQCLWEDAGQVQAHDISAGGDTLVSRMTSNLDADLYLVRGDGAREPLLSEQDESRILDAAFAPALDGVLVLTNAGRDFVGLDLIDAESGARETMLQLDGDIEAISLSPDGKRLAWSVNDEGYSRVCVAAVRSIDQVTQIDLPAGVMDRFSWSNDSNRLLLGWLPATTASRIYVIESDGHARQALADESGDESFPGVAPETIAFETWDGREIPAFWFRTGNSDDAPVVIDVHGGPESQRRPGFHPVLQYLVAAGFHVLTTNVRGSTGYGKAYSHLDDVDLRMNSVRDLEYARKWVAGQSPSFESRISIMGQSYGGFMTLAAITEYPEQWMAAVDVVGIANFVTFLERTGPWRRRHREAEYGSLEHHRDLLTTISPIRKVDDITTPLLVIHGRNDPRVPLHETEQLVASLQARDHTVESIVYDNEGHGLSKRSNRSDGYARVAEFLWSIAGSQDAS